MHSTFLPIFSNQLKPGIYIYNFTSIHVFIYMCKYTIFLKLFYFNLSKCH